MVRFLFSLSKYLKIKLERCAEFLNFVGRYECLGGQSEETITVNDKADLTFLVAKKTPHNMDCQADYEFGTCSRVKLVCNFKMKGTGKACLGDKAVITYGTKTTT